MAETKTPQPAAADPRKSFEIAMAELEQIVVQLEDGETTLEDSLRLFEQGGKLAEECRKHLDDAEGRIEVLVRQRDGKMKAEPFNAG